MGKRPGYVCQTRKADSALRFIFQASFTTNLGGLRWVVYHIGNIDCSSHADPVRSYTDVCPSLRLCRLSLAGASGMYGDIDDKKCCHNESLWSFHVSHGVSREIYGTHRSPVIYARISSGSEQARYSPPLQ